MNGSHFTQVYLCSVGSLTFVVIRLAIVVVNCQYPASVVYRGLLSDNFAE